MLKCICHLLQNVCAKDALQNHHLWVGGLFIFGKNPEGDGSDEVGCDHPDGAFSLPRPTVTFLKSSNETVQRMHLGLTTLQRSELVLMRCTAGISGTRSS